MYWVKDRSNMFSCYKKLFFPSPPSIESSDSLTVPRRHKIFIAFEWREPATSTSHRVKGQKDAFLVQRLFERSSQTCSTYIIQSFDLYKRGKKIQTTAKVWVLLYFFNWTETRNFFNMIRFSICFLHFLSIKAWTFCLLWCQKENSLWMLYVIMTFVSS